MELGAIEGGGTRFRCAVGGTDGELGETLEVPTTDPGRTLGAVLEFFQRRPLAALGLACFGPLGLDRQGRDYGHLLATPKEGWSGADLVGPLERGLGLPVALDTDVNGAALGERWRGAARGLDDLVYVTVGTGVGFGVISGGRPVRGALHPEAGHLPVRRAPGDTFAGCCPFHGDCLEGLVSGPALAARTGRDPRELAHDDPVWEPVVAALAEGLAAAALLSAPRRLVLGGGVGLRPHLLAPLRQALGSRLGGYLPEARFGPLERWLVPAELGERAGLTGALALAKGLARSLPGQGPG